MFFHWFANVHILCLRVRKILGIEFILKCVYRGGVRCEVLCRKYVIRENSREFSGNREGSFWLLRNVCQEATSVCEGSCRQALFTSSLMYKCWSILDDINVNHVTDVEWCFFLFFSIFPPPAPGYDSHSCLNLQVSKMMCFVYSDIFNASQQITVCALSLNWNNVLHYWIIAAWSGYSNWLSCVLSGVLPA